MEKYSYLGCFLALIFFISFAFTILSRGNKSEIDMEKKEQELGFIVNGLKSGGVYSVSDVTHKYLFNRYKKIPFSAKGTIKLGMLDYYVSEITGGYVLICPFEPACDQYHLLLEQKSIQINPTGQFVNLLFIKKQEGAYYNK